MFKRQIQRLLIELLWPRVHYTHFSLVLYPPKSNGVIKTRNYESFAEFILIIKSLCHQSGGHFE